MDKAKQMGRPKRVEDLKPFGLMLPPHLINQVRMLKAILGKTINYITASALINHLKDTTIPFSTDKSKDIHENTRARVEWAKRELERFEGVEHGIYEHIETLRRDKVEYEKLTWQEARDWHTNDIQEQINRAEEDIQLNERRMGYYINVIKMQGRI